MTRRTSVSVSISIAMISSLVFSQTAAVGHRGEISVAAVGPFGEEYRNASLALIASDGTVWNPNADGRRFAGIPYGIYTLKAVGESGVCRREIILNVPRLWTKCGIPTRFGDSEIPGGHLAIEGSVFPAPLSNRNWWTRVEGVYLEFRREELLGPEGRFKIEGLDMGTYMVQLFEGKRFRGQRVVELDSNTSPLRVVIRQELKNLE